MQLESKIIHVTTSWRIVFVLFFNNDIFRKSTFFNINIGREIHVCTLFSLRAKSKCLLDGNNKSFYPISNESINTRTCKNPFLYQPLSCLSILLNKCFKSISCWSLKSASWPRNWSFLTTSRYFGLQRSQ